MLTMTCLLFLYPLPSFLCHIGALLNNKYHPFCIQLYYSLFENARVTERVKELEQRNQHDQKRVLALEREVVLGQDASFAKEREAREERLRADGLQVRVYV